MAEYEKAPEIEVIGNTLIQAYHSHLKEAKISYVFQDKAAKFSDGRTILGKAAGRSNLDKLLSERKEDFVIIIGKDRWEKMTEVERRALVDHELCHCGIVMDAQGHTKFAMRGHPIEEFPENLARFEHRRQRIGLLIENPPSAIAIKQEAPRKIEPATKEEEEK